MADHSELKRSAKRVIDIEASDGDEPVGEAWDQFESVATPSAVLALIAENERLDGCEDVLRQLASYVGSGGYNAPEVDPETFARKIMDGINILNDPLAQLVTKKGEQIDQLKAEIAGLKTGYAAYGLVNAGLKAELEGLRKALAECGNSLHGEMLQKYHGQKPEGMHPVTRRDYDRDMSELAGYAAMGQGEQS